MNRFATGILLSFALVSSAAADDLRLRYFLSSPAIEKMSFNGIDGSAELAITPPDEVRPLTDAQNDLLARYRVAEDKCRGSRPGPDTDRACAERDGFDLTGAGICYGLKDQSMAESEWHACRVSSYGYEIGSETLNLTCRPGENLVLSFGIGSQEGLVEAQGQNGTAKVGETTLDTTYSVTGSSGKNGRTSILYEFGPPGAALLRQLYDGHRVVLPLGAGSTLVLHGSVDRKLRDELARAYSICKQ